MDQLTTSCQFQRSDTFLFGETLGGYAFTSDLVEAAGCHIHLWLPQTLSADQRAEIEEQVRLHRDAVTVTWEPETEEVTAWRTAKHPPAGFIAPSIHALLRWSAENRGYVKLFWGQGKRLTVDAFSLSVLAAVYEKVTEQNREKMARLTQAGPAQFLRMMELCFSAIK